MEPLLIIGAVILALPLLISQPKTTVVLLDNESTHNAVVVTTNVGNTVVDQPYSYTVLEDPNKNPSAVEKANPDEINKRYAQQLAMLPTKPVSMLFHFEQGTSTLTESSKNQVDELIRIIASREPCAVDIIGHSDRAGDADKNYELALERAHTVEVFLQEHSVKLERSSVSSYGENDNLIPTDDGISEPQNRRVEVIVR